MPESASLISKSEKKPNTGRPSQRYTSADNSIKSKKGITEVKQCGNSHLIKSLKIQNHNLILEINRSFTRAFTVIYQYLKKLSKVNVPKEIYTNFKIGLLEIVKQHILSFTIKIEETVNKKNTKQVLKCLKDLDYVVDLKLTFNRQTSKMDSKGQHCISEFLNFETNYLYKLDVLS